MAKRYRRSSRRWKGKGKGKITLPKLLCLLLISVVVVWGAYTDQLTPVLTAAKTFLTGKAPDQIQYPCEVRFIDVGQGDSTLILSDGKTVLIDAGENDRGGDVVDYLRALRIKTIDLMVATHPHSDHIGGLDTVLRAMDVKKVIMPKVPNRLTAGSDSYLDFLQAVKKEGITPEYPKPDETFTFGKGCFTVLGAKTPLETDNLNDYSIVMKFVYDEKTSFLFTGDMEAASEQAILATYPKKALRSDVLKAAHHGSKTSTISEFYKAVNPQLAVLLLGVDNTYGFPHAKTMKTFATNGAGVFRTDYQGNITMGVPLPVPSSDGGTPPAPTLQISCEKAVLDSAA